MIVAIRSVMICVLLAILVNALVAWGLAASSAFYPQPRITASISVNAGNYTRVPRDPISLLGTELNRNMDALNNNNSSLFTIDKLSNSTRLSTTDKDRRMWFHDGIVTAGWPLDAFTASVSQNKKSANKFECLGGWILNNKVQRAEDTVLPYLVIVPYNPLWTGMVINICLYAMAMWLCVPGARLARQRIRAYRKLCLVCGYPRTSQGVCPECGKQQGSLHSRPNSNG